MNEKQGMRQMATGSEMETGVFVFFPSIVFIKSPLQKKRIMKFGESMDEENRAQAEGFPF
jgi:hypothetical protein